jgi:hypothetical protein
MEPIEHHPITAEDARAARTRFAGTPIVRTPLVRLGGDDAPAEIHLKLESLQPIGSFKIRGMWNGIAGAGERARSEGVWTLSAGNTAQGLAWAARRLGVPCRVVVPDSASPIKLAAVERLGAELPRVPIAQWFEFAATQSVPGLEGVLVHPFSDRAVMAGNGTIALEILEDLPDVEAVVVPWGGGGLCCGIAGVLRDLAPNVKVFACEFSPTGPLHAALEADKPVEVPTSSHSSTVLAPPRSRRNVCARARPRRRFDCLHDRRSCRRTANHPRAEPRRRRRSGCRSARGGTQRGCWIREDRVCCLRRQHRPRKAGEPHDNGSGRRGGVGGHGQHRICSEGHGVRMVRGTAGVAQSAEAHSHAWEPG